MSENHLLTMLLLFKLRAKDINQAMVTAKFSLFLKILLA